MRDRELTFELVSGSPRTAAAVKRERDPHAMIGFAAEDEAAALAAIAGGADEAAVFAAVAPSELLAFLERIELRAQLRAETERLKLAFAHVEKLSELGTLIAGVSHEINNPLTSILLSLYVLKNKLVPAALAAREALELLEPSSERKTELARRIDALRTGIQVPELLDDVNSAALNIASVVQDLRMFSRHEQSEPLELVDVPDLLDRVVRLVARDISQSGVIERDYARDLPSVLAPRSRLAQVFTNLLNNALHAIAEAPRELHAIRIRVRRDEDFVVVAISDTGPGIEAQNIEQIFEPYFTTKRAEHGTGLGLSISRSIVRNLGGDLSVESVYGEGAMFLCLLPIRRTGAEHTTTSRPPLSEGRKTPALTVLTVDADAQVLRSYARLLALDHHLLAATDELEAIELLQTGAEPDVIALELDLPDGGGVALLRWLQAHHPALLPRTILVTTFDAPERHGELLASHRGPVLPKPLRGDTLLSVLRELSRGFVQER
ncbi:MAG TPA: ATP-binding protein [Polyangiales bacterium]|nr:ATP-binding protein [Polyangiales bacterium]